MKRHIIPLILLAIVSLCGGCQDPSKLTIGNLQCELLDAPLAIDNTTPHFSWKMTSPTNGVNTTAYQILVATETDKLNEEQAAALQHINSVFDSGRTQPILLHGVTGSGKTEV